MMKMLIKKTGFANLPDEKKEFAVKVQMPEVLRGSLTKG
jgi:hypothetical protein